MKSDRIAAAMIAVGIFAFGSLGAAEARYFDRTGVGVPGLTFALSGRH